MWQIETTKLGIGISLVVLGACAGPKSQVAGAPAIDAATVPDAMSAQQHNEMAAGHEQIAAAHRKQYNPYVRDTRAAPAPPRFRDFSSDGTWPIGYYNPTAQHRAEADRHSELSKQHARAAVYLQDFEDAECARFRPDVRVRCPLAIMEAPCPMVVPGTTVSAGDTEGGAALAFTPDGENVDDLRASVQRMAGMHDQHDAMHGGNAVVEEIEGGARIVVTPAAPEQLDRLRAHVTQRAQMMQSSSKCLMTDSGDNDGEHQHRLNSTRPRREEVSQ